MSDARIPAIGPATIFNAGWLDQEISATELRIADLRCEMSWRTEQAQTLAAEGVREKLEAETATLERLRADRDRLDEERAEARARLRSARAAARLARQAYESWLVKEYFAAAALMIAGRQLERTWIELHAEFERAADAIFGTRDPDQRAAKARSLFGDDAGSDEIMAPQVSMVLASGRKPLLLVEFLHLPAVAELHQLLDQVPPDQLPAALCVPVA